MMLISTMTFFLPVSVVVPIHAVSQLFSNFSRAFFSYSSMVRSILVPFIVGVVAGVPGALALYQRFEAEFLFLPLGLFILLAVWLFPQYSPPTTEGLWHPFQGTLCAIHGRSTVAVHGDRRPFHGCHKPLLNSYSKTTTEPYTDAINIQQILKQWKNFIGFALLGFIQTYLTLLVGASAPLNLPFLLRQPLTRDELIATAAAMMTGVSMVKIAIFAESGFCFSEYAVLLCCLTAAVFAGSWLGTRVRQHISEAVFTRALKVILTILALRLVIQALI